MKNIMFMAMSADGFIADNDGSEEFLSHYNWKVFCRLANDCGGIIWGRKTYEAVKDWGPKYFQPLEKVKKVVLTRENKYVVDEGYQKANNPVEAVEILRDLGVKDVLVTGGSKVNGVFLEQDLIDEVRLNIEPVLLGEGISLISSENAVYKMELIEIIRMDEEILQVVYRVIK